MYVPYVYNFSVAGRVDFTAIIGSCVLVVLIIVIIIATCGFKCYKAHMAGIKQWFTDKSKI